MIVFSWNIRGCNDPLKYQEVLDFFRAHKVDVFCVLETRIKEAKASNFFNKLKPFSVIHNYTCHANGRIWVVWNPFTVTVTPIAVHTQFIHCSVRHHSSCSQFHVTFVYASNDAKVRVALWSELCTLSASIEEWIVLGDFNVVRDASERISHHSFDLHDILEFNECILRCGLEDIKGIGCEYTWTNKQDNSRVWCKLDRAMVNSRWLIQFSSSSTNFLPAGVSDHSLMFVTIFSEANHRKRFSFLNFWVTDPSYVSVVQQAWAIPVYGSPMFRFFAKLRNVKHHLLDMHTSKFSNIQKRLDLAKSALADCQLQLQNCPLDSHLAQVEKRLLEEYTKLRGIELSILKQWSKADNVVYNHSGTSYFYGKSMNG
ncbi:hypothetical protein RND81_12G134700, partial [Saponaria officinalis]